MTSKVLALIGAQVLFGIAAIAAILAGPDRAIEPAPVAFAVFTLAVFGLMQLPPTYLELRRHGSWVTPTDGVYVIGLLALGPIGFVLAVGLAELLSRLRLAQSLLKRAFNLASIIGGAAFGAWVFTAVGGSDPLAPRTWAGAVLSLTAIAAWDMLMTALVLTIAEREPLRRTVGELAPAMGLGLLAAVPLGLVALVLYAWSWWSLLLLVPIMGLVHLSTDATSRQRSERQRVQQLADSSAQLVALIGTGDLLVRIAQQARELVTGATAIAIGITGDGVTTARTVDDSGDHRVDAATREAVLGIVGGADSTRRGETAPPSLPREQRRTLPAGSSILWVVHRTEDADVLIVAVFRELLPDGGDKHRADVLATFVAHAATALANVKLHADLRATLEQELTLSRRKDEFVAAVSHELRTPLTSIGGAVETLRHRGDALSAGDRKKLLDLAIDHTARLRGLIEDVLLVAQGDDHTVRPTPEAIDVPVLLDGLEREHQPWFEGRLSVVATMGVHRVASDADKIRRILVHLLDNARKYAPEGPVELRATQRGERLRFDVTDHGPGIATADRTRIFDRFVQLDSSTTRAQGGLGMGLHLCAQLAESLGGHVSVCEPPGGGARFTLLVPLGGPAPTS